MVCQGCKEEVDQLSIVRVGGRKKKYCEDCRDRHLEQEEVAAEAEGAMQSMMEYKGR